VVPQLARGHDAKGASGRQRAAFRATQGVFATTGIVDNLTLLAARQIEVACEHVARIAAAVVAIARAFVGPVAIVRVAIIRARASAQLP
jgi:hypothetical protein